MKKSLKKIAQPLIKLGMNILFPKVKDDYYYTYYFLKMGLKQKLFGYNKNVPWPVHPTSIVKCPEKIQYISKAPGTAIGCYLDGRNGIIMEENVWLGPRVSLISQNHDVNDYNKYITEQPIIIRKNCLLTTNCVILPGVELGEHTVVAAGAVVRDSFPEGNQLLAGNPAKVVKKLDDYKG